MPGQEVPPPLDPEQWRRLRGIFHQAVERPSEARAAFLDEACGDDAELRRDIDALLRDHEQAGSFLPSPPGAAPVPAAGPILEAGARLGPYETTALIGMGGMGEVYRARDIRLGREVAVKVLHRGLIWSAVSLRRFEQEAQAASALNHPNIIAVYDVGSHEGLSYLVTELLEGQTLAERITAGPVPLGKAVEWSAQAARGLAAAHERGIVHRDLKPANLFVTGSGVVKILDFGLAKVGAPIEGAPSPAAGPTITVPGVRMGTVGYMSPEQVRGGAADFRSDQFSLGCVLYLMLAGKAPFHRLTAGQTLAAVLEDEPVPVLELNPRVPSPLAWIVERCLAKEPEDRYAATGDLARDLELALKRLSAQSGPAAAVGRRGAASAAGRGLRRTVPLWWALLPLLLLAMVAPLPWLRSRNAAAPAPLPEPPVVVLMDSPSRERVYDPRTLAEGGTNADDLTDVLRGLDVVLHKEMTSAAWHREDQVLKQRPRLVVAHLSSLVDTRGEPEETPLGGLLYNVAWDRFRTFIALVAAEEPQTRFLIYTRRFAEEAEHRQFLAELEQRFPVLAGRVALFHVPGDRATFRDLATAADIKRQVVAMLADDWVGKRAAPAH